MNKGTKATALRAGTTFKFNVASTEGIYVRTNGIMSHERIDNAHRFHGAGEKASIEAFNNTEFTVTSKSSKSGLNVEFLAYNAKKGKWLASSATIRADRLPAGVRVTKI